VALALRVALGLVWIYGGATKLADTAEALRAVRAYQLLPESLVVLVGYGLPFLEIMLGLLLIVGLGTRVVAMLSAALLVAFVAGIASAWARGLQIECGCFGGGGLSTDPTRGYVEDIARDLGLLAVSAFLAFGPASKWSLDGALRGPTSAEKPGGATSRQRGRRHLAGAAALILLAAVVGVGTAAQLARLGTSDPAAGIPQGTLGRYAIAIGDSSAPAKVEVLEDYLCPFCRSLDQALGDALTRLADNGSAFVVYRPVAFLDQASTTNYSSRALAASGCVVDLGGPAAFTRMHGLLFDNQPPEGTAGLSDDELSELAAQTGVSASAASACIDEERFAGWASSASEQASKDGVAAIPTVIVNGEQVTFSGEEDPVETLRRAVDSAS
jgi:protein-disulfide isomerase